MKKKKLKASGLSRFVSHKAAKVAEAADGGTIEIWGDGTAMRAYTYIDDMVDGIVMLMHSNLENGVNIGRQEYVSVDQLANLIAEIAGKKIFFHHIAGPVGVKAALHQRLGTRGD
ncbi:MAG: NAD-dependent epimerase/dehydratase family protein [Opitutaceae bacterium]|nr:NAD-dependent epimerase/dehydratase family protein [Opitutaceae bacterium]